MVEINHSKHILNKIKGNRYTRILLPLIIFLAFIQFETASAQRNRNQTPPEDTTSTPSQKDPINIPAPRDSALVAIDTIPPVVPILKHGSINLTGNYGINKISKKDLLYFNYTGLSEIIEETLYCYPLNTGAFGAYNNFSVLGANPNQLAFQFNGKALFDLYRGSFNPDMIAPEFFENIEILYGSKAIVLGDASSGALINIQEPRYNTAIPYTRLWFSEAAGDYMAADGIFSHNIIKNWNLTLGFKRAASDGRFGNSRYDSWNLRLLLRFNPDSLTSISISEVFNNHGSGINGGINEDNSIDLNGQINIYDELFSKPNYEVLNERSFRHDLTLSLSKYLTDNKLSSISGNIYFSNELFELGRDSFFFNSQDSLAVISTNSRIVGANARYEQDFFGILKLMTGGDISYLNAPKFLSFDEITGISISGFAWAEIPFDSLLMIHGGARIHSVEDKFAISVGLGINSFIGNGFMIGIDNSRSETLPNPSNGTSISKESHQLILGTVQWNDKVTSLGLMPFYRLITNPIITEPILNAGNQIIDSKSFNGESRSLFGINASFSRSFDISEKLFNIEFYLKELILKIDLNSNISISGFDDIYPKLRSVLSLSTLFNAGRSTLEIGLKHEFLDKFKGYSLFPIKRTYFKYDEQSDYTFKKIDVFLKAKLGDAFVRFDMENLLNENYYYMPLYPQFGRIIRFSLSWAFFN